MSDTAVSRRPAGHNLKIPAVDCKLRKLYAKADLSEEFFQLIVFIVHLRKGQALNGALMAGKLCTTVLFISLIALVLFPRLNTFTIDLIVLVDILFLAYSFASYVLAYFGRNKKVQDMG